MTLPKVVLDTDLVLAHLTGRQSPSLMRLAVRKFFCYTTVFTAIEVFSSVRTVRDRTAVEEALAAIKVLGLNPKNAPRYGALLSASPSTPRFAPLIAGLCIESRLPLLTGRPAYWRTFRDLRVIPADAVATEMDGRRILIRFRAKNPPAMRP